MALWTPYAADQPLDLSKVKEERQSPAECVDCYNSSYYNHRPYVPPTPVPEYVQPVQPVPYYPTYVYRPCIPVPSTQITPESAGSSPGYEASVCRPPTISPPESLPSANFMTEADVLSEDPGFQAFERDALRAMAEKNGGSLLGNNPRMRRAVQTTHTVDDTYRKQRERNNMAAKQSRDRRKLREIHLSLKVAYLKNEVAKLKSELAVKRCIRCHYTEC